MKSPRALQGISQRILQVSAEVYPLVKTGGLADVTGALPAALTDLGCDVRLLLPGFASVLAGLASAETIATLTAPWGATAELKRGVLTALNQTAYVIDTPAYYLREGGPYEGADRKSFIDNDYRFAMLSWVAGQLANGIDLQWLPHIVHAHDWHAGLAPAYIAAEENSAACVGTVFTVHNLAYQGNFPAARFGSLGLPEGMFSVDGLEFYGQVSFMKAGLTYADRLTTVSPTYADEIQTAAQGCGLEGLLRHRAGVLSGILNGVDGNVWDPATDPAIHTRYNATSPAGKHLCKAALQREFGLAVGSDAPLFGVVSRLTEQKGLNLVAGVVDDIVANGGQLVVLGSGDAALEAALLQQAKQHPTAVAVHIGYDEQLAHRIFSATDITFVPSRYEPCGLTQMYGLKYGSLPLVHRVGGLADTVVDANAANLSDGVANGFVFDELTHAGIHAALIRALELYRTPDRWATIVNHAMQHEFGWDASAAKYASLYADILNGL